MKYRLTSQLSVDTMDYETDDARDVAEEVYTRLVNGYPLLVVVVLPEEDV